MAERLHLAQKLALLFSDENEEKQPLTSKEEEERRIAELGRPVLGEHTKLEIIIEESYEFKVWYLSDPNHHRVYLPWYPFIFTALLYWDALSRGLSLLYTWICTYLTSTCCACVKVTFARQVYIMLWTLIQQRHVNL